MKRSEVNQHIDEAIAFITGAGITLPPHATWTLETWYENQDAAEEMRKRVVGWNITDFGFGDFYKRGIVMYTPSNGIMDPETYKPVDQEYAHRYFILREGQQIETEHHLTKIEDIVVFAGGQFEVQLHNAGPNDELDTETDVRIMRNGIWETYSPGTIITLVPGERIRFEPRHYHRPMGKGGKVLLEEVSDVTDDLKENCHLPGTKPMVFSEIEEDEKPKYLLATELPGTPKFETLVKMYLE